MKEKIVWLLVSFLVVLLVLSGCGVPQEEHDAVVAERDAAQAEVASLQSELTEAENQIETLDGDLTEAENQIQTLEGEYNEAKGALEQAQRQISSLKSNLGALQSQISPLKSDLAATEDELAATQSELAATESELAATQSELAAAQSQIETLQSELSAAQVQVSQVEDFKTELAYLWHSLLPKIELVNHIVYFYSLAEANEAVRAGIEFRGLTGYVEDVGDTELSKLWDQCLEFYTAEVFDQVERKLAEVLDKAYQLTKADLERFEAKLAEWFSSA